MSPIEKKRMEVNLANVKAARLSNELKIDELNEAIERIKRDIQISLDKESELEQKLRE